MADLPELQFDSPAVDTKLPDLDFGDSKPVSRQDAADAESNVRLAEFGAQHPYLRSLGVTAQEAVGRPVAALANELTFGRTPLPPNEESNVPFAAKVLEDVGSGMGKGAAATAVGLGNPILGFGALSAADAKTKGEPVLPAAVKGAASAIPQMLAGAAGGKLATIAARPFAGAISKFAPNVGTALGMGGAAAAMAPEGERLKDFATGATFGALSPIGGDEKTPEQYSKALEKAADAHREILNPGKGIINKLEIKSGKDINDVTKRAAELWLTYDKDQAGKLDTTKAIEKVEQTNAPIYQQLDQILSSDPTKQFDLEKIGQQTKADLAKKYNNADELAKAQAKIDQEINAEIKRHGQMVDGSTLNQIKKGMWGKSYNFMEPNANDAARQIGYTAKSAIETAYPGKEIKALNAETGKNLDLRKLLEASHGQVIQGGKLGKYFSRVTGTMIGGAAGHLSSIPGSEALGAMVGNEAGAKIQDFVNDPNRKTRTIARKLSNMKVEKDAEISPESPAYTKAGEQPLTNAPLSQFNPLNKPQSRGTSIENKKGGMDIGGRTPEDLKLELELNLKYKNSREYRSDKSYKEFIDAKIIDLQNAIKQVGKSPMGLMMGSGIAAAAMLGAPNANAMAQQKYRTIGQKNNNPINLKAFDKWDGMTGKDSFGHAQFKDLDSGIRAGLKNLKNHQAKNPHHTLEQYLNTFAQKNGSKEAAFIAKSLGVSPKASLASLSMEKVIIPLAQFESKIQLTPKDIQRVKQKFNIK